MTHERIPSELEFQSVDDEAPDLSGEVIDERYRVVELIGTGGMGRVYRAEQIQLQRPVAIKVLHPGYSSIPEVGRRFEREAVAIARLDHPNCVSVQDFGRLANGSLFLVMPLLVGELLSDALARGPLEEASALRVARHILCGLAHSHAAGIVHRDIKTDNVMLVEHEGDPAFAKILDFGIAKLVDAVGEGAPGTQLTVAGQRFGTPAYMSPEQATGRPPDHRTDIYSTTVVLFEMLTGVRPFEAPDEFALMEMQSSTPPPPLADRAAGRRFAPELEQLVARGLAKNPEERYQSAAELIAAIDALTGAVQARAAGRVAFMDGKDDPRRTPAWAIAGAGAPAAAGPDLPAPEPASGRSRNRARGSLWNRVKHHRISIVAGAVILAAFVVSTALLASRSKDSGSPHAARARALLAEGKPVEAIAYLTERREAIEGDADALLELGHAHSAALQYDEAAAAYGLALEHRKELSSDRTMRTNLMLMLDNSDGSAAEVAGRLLVGELDDDEARDRIVELASADERLEFRARMRTLAEELGLGSRIDRVRSYGLDLAQGKTCEDRRHSVAQLRALGDAAALPALEKARDRGKRNRCLRTAAEDAIRYLEALREK